MNFRKSTLKMLKRLSSDDQWAYFFDNIESKADEVPEELISFLADMLASEIGAHSSDLEKIKYFIRLGYFSHE
mgnify:CR=1 FL=1